KTGEIVPICRILAVGAWADIVVNYRFSIDYPGDGVVVRATVITDCSGFSASRIVMLIWETRAVFA
ncbi:MAG: hypothetical protein KDA60_19945, partial [Planctomycetales bacterium]|nr:hypothetical protein [Planctomycetales bacterium]